MTVGFSDLTSIDWNIMKRRPDSTLPSIIETTQKKNNTIESLIKKVIRGRNALINEFNLNI